MIQIINTILKQRENREQKFNDVDRETEGTDDESFRIVMYSDVSLRSDTSE